MLRNWNFKPWKKVYIDALNYMRQFVDIGGNSWDHDLLNRRVEYFCNLLKKRGIYFKVFIDAGTGTDECNEVWK